MDVGFIYAINSPSPPPSRTIVALVYNVLKTFMEMNNQLFDELTLSYKAERQKEKRKEVQREEAWKKVQKRAVHVSNCNNNHDTSQSASG